MQEFFSTQVDPSPILSPFVRRYCIVEMPMDGNPQYSPATTRSLMVIQYNGSLSMKLARQNESYLSLASMTGMTTQPYFIKSSDQRSHLFIIEFTPVGASSLFHHKGSTLANQNCCVSDLISSSKLHAISESLSEVSSPIQKVELVESFLLQFLPDEKHLFKLRAVNGALDIIHSSGANITIKNLSRSIRCSERHLRRLFDEHVGISTKNYLRLTRFLDVYHSVIKGRTYNIDPYYDQPHLIKDFTSFTGHTPGNLPIKSFTLNDSTIKRSP